MTRAELEAKSSRDVWSHDVPTDAKEFYFIPRVFALRTFDITPVHWGSGVGAAMTRAVIDVDMSLTPLYVAEGQEVVMRISGGNLQIRVSKIK